MCFTFFLSDYGPFVNHAHSIAKASHLLVPIHSEANNGDEIHFFLPNFIAFL